MLESFSDSFAEARGKFRSSAEMAGFRLHAYGRNDLTGKDGEFLASDVAVAGASDARRAAIVISGTHGSEGYCGSAILNQWLSGYSADPARSAVKIVLLHAINPWAFSHKTRATENNVDLNRNFLDFTRQPARANPSYEKLVPYLHGPARSAADHLAGHDGLMRFLARNGAQIEGESWEGQSSRPDGIFYTGTAPEWSNRVFRQVIREHLAGATRVGFIDWHTGIGRYGEIVPLVFDERGSDEFREASRWWQLDSDADGAFRAGSVPKYDGLLCKAIRQELPDARIAGAVIEYGTTDDYAMFRSDRLDRWLRFEGRDDPEFERLRADYMAACCPQDVAWRRFVLETGPGFIDRMVDGVASWAD